VSITADMVKELRDRTGAGMMDCKRALTETGGDMDAAMEFLRKKGLAVAEKRKGRATKEGLIRICVDGKVGGMVEVNCETDFVARNAEFETFATALAKHLVASKPASLDTLLAQKIDGQTVQAHVTGLMGKIGENMLVSRFARVSVEGPGVLEPYLHAGSRVGVLVALGADSEEVAAKQEFREIAHELALQIAFSNPICLDRSGVPADLVEREKRISRERAIEQGKPEKILDKIVEGQLNKFYGESVLLEQPYVKEEKNTVGRWLESRAKSLGAKPVIQTFVRFALGEAVAEGE
jgi:elongation factor Ts